MSITNLPEAVVCSCAALFCSCVIWLSMVDHLSSAWRREELAADKEFRRAVKQEIQTSNILIYFKSKAYYMMTGTFICWTRFRHGFPSTISFSSLLTAFLTQKSVPAGLTH